MKINQITPTPPVEVTGRPQQRPVETKENTPVKKQPSPVEVHKAVVANEIGNVKEDFKDDEMLAEAVKQANKTLGQYNRYIDRQVHDVTKTVMYSIKDRVTNEVIAEFPPKKIQDMIAKMWELAGLFVDEKA
jgi:uncharacterized FlaG/YvyC family protein